MGQFKNYKQINEHINEAFNIKIKSKEDLKLIDHDDTRKVASLILDNLPDSEFNDTTILSYQADPVGLKLARNLAQYKDMLDKKINQKITLGNGSSEKRKLPHNMTPTIFFETAAAYGFLLNKVDNIESTQATSDVLQITDWASMKPYLDEFKSIAQSSINFKNKMSLTVKDIIHKDIKTFYKKLESLEGIEKIIKSNTADIVVITNGTKDHLYSVMKKGTSIIFEESTGEIDIAGVKFYQISLKESKDGARLGRLTTIFSDLYDHKASDILKLEENFIQDLFGAISSKAKELFLQIKNKFNKIITFFNKELTPSKIEKDLEKIAKKLNLNESKLIFSINSKLDNLKETPGFKVIKPTFISKEPTEKNYLNLLKANLVSFYYLERFINDYGQTVSDAVKIIADLNNLMRKGATNLPLIVLYGSGSYEVVLNQQSLNVSDTTIYPFVLNISNSGNDYYVVDLYMLKNLGHDENLTEYVKIQFNNAGGDTFSFKVEGNAIRTLQQVRSLIN